jgi:hypothetical protein
VNPGGLAVIVLGVWVGCQIFGGNALERLGIVSTSSPSTPSTPGAVYTPPAPATGPAPASWT